MFRIEGGGTGDWMGELWSSCSAPYGCGLMAQSIGYSGHSLMIQQHRKSRIVRLRAIPHLVQGLTVALCCGLVEVLGGLSPHTAFNLF